MNLTNLADKGEIRDAVKAYTDTRFTDSFFENIAIAASTEIKNVLRPQFLAAKLDLASYGMTGSLSGTASAIGTDTINLTGSGWTASQFTTVECEAVLWTSAAFWVADITANTATALTVSSRDGSTLSITTTPATKFYIRKKNLTLNQFAINLGIYHFYLRNRVATGVDGVPENVAALRRETYNELSGYLKGLRDFEDMSASDTIVLDGTEWQYLSHENLVPGTIVVTVSGVAYKESQGWQIEYTQGRIRYFDASGQNDTYIASDDTIVVTYRYSLRVSDIGIA